MQTHAHGGIHIKESTKGAAECHLLYIWVPPWARVRVFGLSGQVLHIRIALMCDFAYGFPHGHGPGPTELPPDFLQKCVTLKEKTNL